MILLINLLLIEKVLDWKQFCASLCLKSVQVGLKNSIQFMWMELIVWLLRLKVAENIFVSLKILRIKIFYEIFKTFFNTCYNLHKLTFILCKLFASFLI